MGYDFTKPPEGISIYRHGKNKKAHLYFQQGSTCYAFALFQSKEMEEYFEKNIGIVWEPDK